jgi:hypothetical protein
MSEGRDAILLADGCTAIVPGVNVVQRKLENVHPALQVVDPVLGMPMECTDSARTPGSPAANGT